MPQDDLADDLKGSLMRLPQIRGPLLAGELGGKVLSAYDDVKTRLSKTFGAKPPVRRPDINLPYEGKRVTRARALRGGRR